MALHPRQTPFAAVLLLSLPACGGESAPPPAWAQRPWAERVLEGAPGGRAAIADVDGDGRPDVVLHEWRTPEGGDGSLAWFDGRSGARHEIAREQFFGDAVVAADLDGDGDTDVAAPVGSYGKGDVLVYLQDRGAWTMSARLVVDKQAEVKDLEVADLDHDGRVDLVVRGKSAVTLFFGGSGGEWTERKIPTRPREGLALGDLDGDGDEDIALNGFWLETPDDPRTAEYEAHVFDEMWFSDDTGKWQDFSSMVGTGDLDGDGRTDIVIGHSEKPGVDVWWYGRGEDGGWTKNRVGVCDWCHTLHVADFDEDGRDDVLVGETKRTPAAVLRVLRNQGDGRSFDLVPLPPGPSYKAAVGDADGDGDLDVVGAASWVEGPLRVLTNPLAPQALGPFERRHLAELPGRAVFVMAGDMDGDGDMDLVAGAHWFENRGSLTSPWTAHEIGAPLLGAALVADLDGDGALDVFGTQGAGSAANHRLAFARGRGDGTFEVRGDLPAGAPADFLQGRVVIERGDARELLLSWHAGQGGVQRLTVPAAPMTGTWSTDEVSALTLREDLETFDLDRDGDLDVLMGTHWLRRDGDAFTPQKLGDVSDLDATRHAPKGVVGTDRLGLADLDGDGRMDLVAGCEGAQEILWFQAPQDPATPWTRHVLARVPGEGYSLATCDLDRDGDPDVIVGEHRAKQNRVVLLENARGDGSRFVERVLDDGRGNIDHHDGTLPVDLDGDGDLDIVSIGWKHPHLWVLENRAVQR